MDNMSKGKEIIMEFKSSFEMTPVNGGTDAFMYVPDRIYHVLEKKPSLLEMFPIVINKLVSSHWKKIISHPEIDPEYKRLRLRGVDTYDAVMLFPEEGKLNKAL